MIPASAREFQLKTHPLKEAFAVILLIVIFLTLCWQLTLAKHFALDEYNYSHAAWLISQGHVPYRDFFAIHTPLSFYFFALPTLHQFSAIELLEGQRYLSAIVLLIASLGVYRFSRTFGLDSAIVASVAFLLCQPISRYGTEIRPDLLGIACIVWSLHFICQAEAGTKSRALISGVLFGLAVLFTEKALLYAAGSLLAIFAYGFLHKDFLKTHVLLFLLGSLTVALGFFLFLTGSGAKFNFGQVTLKFLWEHEQSSYGFAWQRYFTPFLKTHWPMLILAMLGGLRSLRQFSNRLELKELILLAGFLSSLLYFLSISIPYPYNLQGLCLFSALLLAKLLEPCRRSRIAKALNILGCLALLFMVFNQSNVSGEEMTLRDRQTGVLKSLAEITTKDSCVYDNSGQAVNRHHADYYFFNSRWMRNSWSEHFENIVPSSIIENGCAVMLSDLRVHSLPKKLSSFLDGHFLPYRNGIRLWGQELQVGEQEFTAIKEGRYHLSSSSKDPLDDIWINGEQVQGNAVLLSKGEHRIRREARSSNTKLYLLWTPTNGEYWHPNFALNDDYSRMF